MHPLQAPLEQTFAEPARRFTSLFSNDLPRSDADKIDQSKNAQQGAKAMLLSYSRTLQIEAATFERLEQALDFPSTAVIREQISPLATGDNQPFSVSERLSSKVNWDSKEKKSTCFATIGSTEERTDLLILFLRSQDTIVLFDSDSKRDFLFDQPLEPVFPGELTVSREILYLRFAK
jgi:hypothetical protein